MRKNWLLIPLMMVLLFTHSAAQNPPAKPPFMPVTRGEARDGPLGKTRDAPPGKPRDIKSLPVAAQPIFNSAYLAMQWLKSTNKPDGRFVYGFLPALRAPMDGDNFVSQAGAAFALSRAARYFRDERGTAIARQALLTLLMETAVDAKDPTVRHTAAPPIAVNRLASHGLLILAIHELADPRKATDLLDQADQLSNYLRRLQREDGSLIACEGDTTKRPAMQEIDAHCAGLALHALMVSQKHRAADWKLAMTRKALGYYYGTWKTNKNVLTVVSHTPAYAEAYLRTGDAAFAEAVFAMNDWLIGLQYREEENSSRKHWLGGFQRYTGGKTELAIPDIGSALHAESLAEACRVARRVGDLPRLQRYERALLLDLHFLMTLQYTLMNTEHFVEPFRPAILGGFHGSHQDGDLRLDYTQHPLCAMVQYLETVIE
jgi:hypothetical protein